MDLACGIYAITTAVAIQMFERSRYGRTRKKQKFYPRVLVYIFMILPALYNLVTMLGGLAMLPAIVGNIVSGKFEEIYTPPKPRKGRKNDDGPSYSLQLFYQIGGVSREGRGGRMFVLTVYTVANLYDERVIYTEYIQYVSLVLARPICVHTEK